jgi:hypothetical protein
MYFTSSSNFTPSTNLNPPSNLSTFYKIKQGYFRHSHKLIFKNIKTTDSWKWWFFGHLRNCGDRNVSKISMIRANGALTYVIWPF